MEITFQGVVIPVPIEWKILPDGNSYAGSGGLLDVRVRDYTAPFDDERLIETQAKRQDPAAKVELLTVRGFKCLYLTYEENQCRVLAYTFGTSESSEVAVVYVFRPGFEALARQVHEQVTAGG